jgi:hypothetical protein
MADEKEKVKVTKKEAEAAKVASPTGPVPASAVAATVEDAQELLKEQRQQTRDALRHPRATDELDEETVKRLSRADLATVAHQRGYEFPGRRITPDAFMEAQKGKKK